MSEIFITTSNPTYGTTNTITNALLNNTNLDKITHSWTKTSPYFADKNTIKNVIFNPPATIVFWNDDTKTVVKCQDDETFDPEKGLAMAISKKYFGNKGSYCNQIKKWTEKYEEEQKANEGALAKRFRRAQEVMQKLRDAGNFSSINSAYAVLTNALHKKRPRKDDLTAAMEEAIGYLGEVLDD